MARQLTPEQHAAIDAAVAEKVMGWRWCGVGCDGSGTCVMRDADGSVWLHNGMVKWSPSTDIAAAWEVVLWLRERWGQFSLVAGIGWHCYASENQPDYPEKMGSADTAPLAICLAALKAVGVNTKEWEG